MKRHVRQARYDKKIISVVIGHAWWINRIDDVSSANMYIYIYIYINYIYIYIYIYICTNYIYKIIKLKYERKFKYLTERRSPSLTNITTLKIKE